MGLAQTYKDFKRLKQIANVLFKHEFGFYLNKLKLKIHLPFNKRLQTKKFLKPQDSMARHMRQAMEELSGSFVKLGQLLSLRPDLLPDEYIEEFSKLQDSVHPFPYNKVKDIIEIELHKPLKEIFSKFDKKPIASASVGQVHEAVLKKNGQKVAVKVQRPNIHKIFEVDIDIMYHLAHLVEKHMPEIKNFSPTGIVEEFEKYTKEELDYLTEGRNIDKYRKVVQDEKHVKVPKVYWEFTTSRVLTMEFMDGIKISDSENLKQLRLDRHYLSRTLARTFINGVLYQNFFHADPHPGNILVMKNKDIAILDFGIAGHLRPSLAEKIGLLYFGVINGNVDDIVKGLMEIGSLSEDIDKDKLRDDLSDFFSTYYDSSLQSVDMTKFFLKTLDLGKMYNIKFPKEYTLLVKAMLTAEGTIHKIDPDFNFFEAGKPIFKKYVSERTSSEALLKNAKKTLLEFKDLFLNFPKDARKILDKIEKGKRTDDKGRDLEIERLVSKLDESSNRLTMGLISAALFVTASLLIIAKVQPLIGELPLYALIAILIAFVVLIRLMKTYKD